MSGDPMSAITVHQPWAALIAHGHKTIETRPAPPNGPMRPAGVRGLPGLAIERGQRIAIHAAATPNFGVGREVGEWRVGSTAAGTVLATRPDVHGQRFGHVLAYGAVVATAVVADALPVFHIAQCVAGDAWWPNLQVNGPDILSYSGEGHDLPSHLDDERPLGDYTPGRWGWLLADVEPLAVPVPCRGRQGVWALPADVAEEVRRG